VLRAVYLGDSSKKKISKKPAELFVTMTVVNSEVVTVSTGEHRVHRVHTVTRYGTFLYW
jgi:hypothetical protein